MNSTPSDIEVPAEKPMSATGRPLSKVAKWSLAVLLGAAYVGVQLILSLPVVVYMMVTNPKLDETDLVSDPLFIWTTVIVLGVAAVVTIVFAVSWPAVWRLIDPNSTSGIDDWLGWRTPKNLPLWSIPLITIPLMVVILLAVSLPEGDPGVAIQAEMFRTLPLQIASFLIVSTVVPLAEEAIFRGALFNAMIMPSATGWRGLVVPVVVSSAAFALLHVPSGFVTPGPIIQITLLALYLGVLRASTDSMTPSVVAHMTWNLVSAVGFVLATNLTP